MALVLNDRVKETSTTAGSGTLDLDGAVTGFETFVAGIATTNTTYYCIAHRTEDEWEVGLGTVTDASPDTLSRDTVISSSNSDGKVDFTAGTSDVFCTFPANKTMDMALTTTGDTVYASAANTPTRLAVGTPRYTLQTNSGGTIPEWAASPQSLMTATGDILYASGANTLAKLAKGSDTEVLTLASGIPSWAAPDAGIEWQAVQTSSPITGAAGKGYPVNTTSGAITINLPAGSVGDQIAVVDYAGTFDSNALTIAANGSEKIKGSIQDATMSTERQAGTFVYVDATQGWVLMSAAPDPGVDQPEFITATGGTITTVDTDYKLHTFTGDGTFEVTAVGNAAGSTTVDYLVVAGGAGGGKQQDSPAGGAGGGGAGGMRYSYPNPATGGTAVTATTYPVTVGGGGAAGDASPGKGTVGESSIAFSITSAGGGGGAGDNADAAGAAGGSGGGGVYPSGAGGAGNTPATPVSQGNPGGAGTAGGYGGGSGGGHTAAGTASPASPGGVAGGAGTALTISGASVSYAGGGGGGAFQGAGGAGGAGGGGTGGSGGPGVPAANATAGDDYTGGGGGGSFPGTDAAAGGSGVVLVRYKFQ